MNHRGSSFATEYKTTEETATELSATVATSYSYLLLSAKTVV